MKKPISPESWYISMIMPAVTIVTVIFGMLIQMDMPRGITGTLLLAFLLLVVAVWLVIVGMKLRGKFIHGHLLAVAVTSIIITPVMVWLILMMMSYLFNNHDSEGFAIVLFGVTGLSLIALPAIIVGYAVGERSKKNQ